MYLAHIQHALTTWHLRCQLRTGLWGGSQVEYTDPWVLTAILKPLTEKISAKTCARHHSEAGKLPCASQLTALHAWHKQHCSPFRIRSGPALRPTLHFCRMKAARQTSLSLLGTTTTCCSRPAGMAKPSSSSVACGGEASRKASLSGLDRSWLSSRTEMLTGSCKLMSASRATPWRESEKDRTAGRNVLYNRSRPHTPSATHPGLLRKPWCRAQRLTLICPTVSLPGPKNPYTPSMFLNSDLWKTTATGVCPSLPRKASVVK